MNGISFIYKALIKCCVFHVEENLTVFVFFTFYAFVSISSRERSCSDPVACLHDIKCRGTRRRYFVDSVVQWLFSPLDIS